MSVFIMKESKQKLLLFDQLHRRGKWGGGGGGAKGGKGENTGRWENV